MILFLLVALSDPASAKAVMSKSYGNLSLSFEANQGQTDNQVKFLSRGRGYTLFLTPTEAVLVLRELQHITSTLNNQRETKPKKTEEICSTMLRMKLDGANSNPKIVGTDELPGKSNYFIGNNPKRWRTKIPSYARVKYEGIYPGVDLIYYWNKEQLEYDFIVAPYGDPKAIRLNFEGSDKLEIDSLGNLVFHIAGVEVRLHKPQSYQEIHGVRQAIPGHYVLLDNHQVGFRMASYDASKPLFIDPVLSYSTYLGGSGNDFGLGIAVDAAGNAYIAGITASIDFPIENPFQANGGNSNFDIFITKLNADGSALVYSTYLGGSGQEGTSEDLLPRGIAVDSNGNAYVTNFTTSIDFPTTSGAFQVAHGGGECIVFGGFSPCPDAFVTKLNPTGSALVYSTYLGGSNYDEGRGIAVDANGCAYVTGVTSSTDFPISNPFQANNNGNFDVFVTKLTSDGSSLIYSTYLGGSGPDGGTGIAIDFGGNAYITGGTSSTDYPTTTGAFQATAPGGGSPCILACDAFVTKLNVNGSTLIYSTYLGGSLDEAGSDIAIDGAGNAYVTGVTSSADFPTTEGSFQNTFGGCPPACQFGDAFITKLNDTGSNLVYSSYLGGSGDDGGSGIAVDSFGNAYVTGTTRSIDFPTSNPIQAIFGGGNANAFLTKVNTSGSALIYSTYLGGDFFDLGHDIALDPIGNAYVTGRTASSNFPTTPGAFQHSLGGGYLFDSFIVRVNSTYFDTVQKTYIGYYQRAADPGGLIYWAGRLNDSGGNLNDIIEAFAYSAEAQALYGTIIDSSNISNVVNSIYNALFGRDAEIEGLNWYVNGFNTGQYTPATIMLNVLYGAQNEDLWSVNNKVIAANLFTWTIDPDLDGANFQATYSGNTDAQKARDFLSTVGWDSATIRTQAETTLFIKTNIADPGDPILNP